MRHLLPLIVLASLFASVTKAEIAVVHEDITEFECTGANSGIKRCKLVATINDNRGESLCNWSEQCEKGSFELKSFKAVITEGNGKVTKVKKGDLQKTEYSDNLADDNYTYYYIPRTSSYPMRVEYEWEVSYNTLLVYPKFLSLPTYEVRVDSIVHRIITTDKNTLRYKTFNFEPTEDQLKVFPREGHPDQTVTQLTLTHVPAIEHFGDGLPLRKQMPLAYFAPTSCTYKGSKCDMTDWKSYGLWTYSLVKGRDKLPEELLQKIHAMTDTCTSVKSKVGVIRRWMGETTRYVNIALGIGGYQPRTAEEVYKTGVGDCKALSNYFCSMLHALDIPAVYTLYGDRDLMDDMPTFQQLNHVIVQVPLPGDTLWVECTNPKFPFDYCPSSHRGHEVILVTEQGGILTKIPERVDKENITTEQIDIRVDSHGDADILLDRHSAGEAFENNLYRLEMRNDELRKSVTSGIYMPHPTVNKVDIQKNDKAIDLHLEARSMGWARTSGNRLFIPISLYPTKVFKNDKPHTIDMLNAGFVDEETMTFHLPEGFTIEALPSSQVVESVFGRYELDIKQLDKDIQVTMHMHYNSGVYPAEQYAEWIAFRQKIAALSKKNITLKAIQ